MRTTLTLDPDVSAEAKRAAAALHKPFKEVINAALRIGLAQVLNPPITRPYRTNPKPLGLREGLSYDNIAELLALKPFSADEAREAFGPDPEWDALTAAMARLPIKPIAD